MKKFEEKLIINNYTLLITYWYNKKNIKLDALKCKFYNFDIIKNEKNIIILSFESEQKYENYETTTSSSVQFVDRLYEWIQEDSIESDWVIVFTILELENTSNYCIVIPLKHEYHCSFVPSEYLINSNFKEKFL